MKSDLRIYTWTGIVLIVLTMVALFFLRQGGGLESSVGNHKCMNFTGVVTQQNGEYIQEIIETLSHTSTMGLVFKKGRLKSIGAKLDGKVPSFEFLAYIFSTPTLAKEMVQVKKSSMKYNNLVAGLQESFLEDFENGCLYQRGAAFAKYLGLPKEKVEELLKSGIEAARVKEDKEAFKPLVDYLIATKSN